MCPKIGIRHRILTEIYMTIMLGHIMNNIVLMLQYIMLVLLAMLVASCTPSDSSNRQPIAGTWYTIGSGSQSTNDRHVYLLALYDDMTWESWYFIGENPPSEWGGDGDGTWEYERGNVLILEWGGDIYREQNIISVMEEHAVVYHDNDILILENGGNESKYYRYEGHLDVYLRQLEEMGE